MRNATENRADKAKDISTQITQPLNAKKKEVPLVSIIVLTYNQQYLLRDCLVSILKQKYPKLELVICDDASQDFDAEETVRMIENLKQDNLKNYVIYQQPENVGTTENAKKGIALSSGTIFKLHAGDDMLRYPKVVENIVQKFTHDENVRIIAARSVACTPDGKLTAQMFPSEKAVKAMQESNCVGQFRLMSTQVWGEYINAPAVFWTRELYDEIGGLDVTYKYTEDWPTWLMITKKGYRITSVSDVTTIYRYGGISNGLSETNKTLGICHYNECIRMLEEIALPELQKNGLQKDVKKCKHSIETIKARIICEYDWQYMTPFEKFHWKMSNMVFLIRSAFYRQGTACLQLPTNSRLLLMALVMLLGFYFIQYSSVAEAVSKPVCVFLLLYFGIVKRKQTPYRNVALSLGFLFYMVQSGTILVREKTLFWAAAFSCTAVAYIIYFLIAKTLRFYLLYRERKDL